MRIENQTPHVYAGQNVGTVKTNVKINKNMKVPMFNNNGKTKFNTTIHTKLDAVLNNFSGLSNKDIDSTFEHQFNLNPDDITPQAVAQTNEYWTDDRVLA